MITCNVCGHLNDPSSVVCENCGSDLSDSPDWDDDTDDIYEEDNVYDDGFVDSGMGDEDNEYYDDDYYD